MCYLVMIPDGYDFTLRSKVLVSLSVIDVIVINFKLFINLFGMKFRYNEK